MYDKAIKIDPKCAIFYKSKGLYLNYKENR